MKRVVNPCFPCLFGDEGRQGCNLICGSITSICPSAACEPTNGLNGHIVVTEHLAAQTQARTGKDAFGSQDILFRRGHLLGFSGQELHPTSGTAGNAIKLIRNSAP
jgi:hypothetical protein